MEMRVLPLPIFVAQTTFTTKKEEKKKEGVSPMKNILYSDKIQSTFLSKSLEGNFQEQNEKLERK